MPTSARQLANTAIAGIIYNDTHGGRKREWEIAKLDYVRTVLASGSDCLVCSDHKTWKTYGDIAKWLSPGLARALKIYDTLPRPADVDTFLAPARATAETVSIVTGLKTWARRHLDKHHTHPTVNLYRKSNHKVLMDMTKDAEKLKELMVIIDAHSKFVQDKHYYLKEPEEDVKLAKLLVEKVLGGACPWPSQAFIDDCLAEKSKLGNLFRGIGNDEMPIGNDDALEPDDEEGEEDCDQEEMLWWEGGGDFPHSPTECICSWMGR